MKKDIPAVLLREYRDLTRQELLVRLRIVARLHKKVIYARKHCESPRASQALCVAAAVLIAAYAYTNMLLSAGVAAIVAHACVLRYSTRPQDWRGVLRAGLAQAEPLRQSPLRALVCDPAAPWEYAQFCLQQEVYLIRTALAHAPEPFCA